MQIGNLYLSFITGLFTPFLSRDSFWGNILIGEYGILTMTPIYLLFLLLPLVTAFNFVQHTLDESHLLPRIAKILSRPFRLIGLSGNAVIPILLGFGCVTVALVSTNILGSRRERLITSILLCIAVPCSAQVAVIFAMAFLLDLKYMLLYLFTILFIFYLLGFLLNLLLPGQYVSLPVQTPALRHPDMKGIIKKTALEAKDFLKDSGPTFFLGSMAISILDYFNGFMKLREWFAPVTSGFLHLPENATNLFIMSIIKRDLGAAGLFNIVNNGSFTQEEVLVTLTVLTLFVPCFASQMILFRNGRALTAVLIWFGSFLVAFLTGWVLRLFLGL